MINHKSGDLFKDLDSYEGKVIIPHIVNDIKAWGSGFVIPLGKHFPISKEMYMKECRKGALGKCQIVVATEKVLVANMFAQSGIASKTNVKPIRYAALVDCMSKVARTAKTMKADIAAPKFGSDRAGGNWEFIEELIGEIWKDLNVTIYTL